MPPLRLCTGFRNGLISLRPLDRKQLRTILAASGFDSQAAELLRADQLPFTFTQKEWDAGRAALDLGEAIAVLAARPQVEAALAEATAAVQARFSDEAFERQVALVKRKAELEMRLANLMLADEA